MFAPFEKHLSAKCAKKREGKTQMNVFVFLRALRG